MSSRTILTFGAVNGMIAVLLGAFGAHGLKDMLIATGRYDTYHLAVEYQFYHGLALLTTGILSLTSSSKKYGYAGVSFTLGIFLFSGSLYLLAVLNKPVLGAVTPLGGIFFIVGWGSLLWGIVQNKKASPS
ncbi:MAG TPA: DUF423 domain-containing protein [Cyclobacteriaceae bacterium]|nr:DUF423 domain-containing protein [Cyclobacteriaceae bacterium]